MTDRVDELIDPALAALGQSYQLMLQGEMGTLLLSALDSGLLAECRTPRTPEQLATHLGRPRQVVADVCTCLVSFGVLNCESGAYQLTSDYAAALDPDAGDLLANWLRLSWARSRLLAGLLTDEADYWSTDPDVQRAFAEGVTFPPDAPLSLRIMARTADAVPEARDSARMGGRHLELGCGLAGALLIRLQSYPEATAVGVDLSAPLIEEARRRAGRLGVADRVEFVVADAADYTSPTKFDSVQWSQFFFPLDARAATIEAAMAALVPGGHLMAPLMLDPAILQEDIHSEIGREAALDQLIHRSWGVPMRSADELLDEVYACGFINGRVWGSPPMQGVIAFKP